MSIIYKFLVDGETISMFEQTDGGSFEQEVLRLNQLLSYDAVTGDITLTTTRDGLTKTELFHQTADTSDDPSLYVEGETTFTAPDGTVVPAPHGRHIHGTRGHDIAHGGWGDDHINGYGGNDHITGGDGDDTLAGGVGNDHISGGAGQDSIDGDAGNDRILGGDGDDILAGGTGNDQLRGGAGADQLDGGAGNDRLCGGDGNDSLTGGAGRDLLIGGAGDDLLTGGPGGDRLVGGDGADHFVFADGDVGTRGRFVDRIADFSHDQGDLIDLSGIDADTMLDGDQGFTFIGNADFGSVAGELRVVEGEHGSLLAGDTNGDGAADFLIRLGGVTPPVLDAADFIL